MDMNYLCITARRRSCALTTLRSLVVEGGVKQSHWITIAFWRLCNLCRSTISDDSSCLPILISRDLDRTLFGETNNNWCKSCFLKYLDRICIRCRTKQIPLNDFLKASFWIITWRKWQELHSRKENFIFGIHTGTWIKHEVNNQNQIWDHQ